MYDFFPVNAQRRRRVSRAEQERHRALYSQALVSNLLLSGAARLLVTDLLAGA